MKEPHTPAGRQAQSTPAFDVALVTVAATVIVFSPAKEDGGGVDKEIEMGATGEEGLFTVPLPLPQAVKVESARSRIDRMGIVRVVRHLSPAGFFFWFWDRHNSTLHAFARDIATRVVRFAVKTKAEPSLAPGYDGRFLAPKQQVALNEPHAELLTRFEVQGVDSGSWADFQPKGL